MAKVKSEVNLANFEELKEKLRLSEEKNKKLVAKNEEIEEQLLNDDTDNTDENDETDDNKPSHIPGLSILEGGDYQTEELRERIAEKLKAKLGVDNLDNPLFNVIAEVSEKSTMENKESLGNVFDNITLDEIDPEALQSRIGALYGPGHYEVRVTNSGKMVTRFKWYLSPRKFKKPVEGAAIPGQVVVAQPGNDNMLEFYKLQLMQSEKMRESEAQRNHEIRLKEMESNKSMDLQTILTVADKMANKNQGNGMDPMNFAFKLMEKTIDMKDKADEIRGSKDMIDYIGDTFKEIGGPILQQYVKAKVTPNVPGADNKAQVEAAYEKPKQLDNVPPPKVLLNTGALISLISNMYYGYSSDLENPDDTEIYVDQINYIGINASFKSSILKLKNDELIAMLCTISSDMKTMFESISEDEKKLEVNFKDYAILVFDGVRKAAGIIETPVDTPVPVKVIPEKK